MSFSLSSLGLVRLTAGALAGSPLVIALAMVLVSLVRPVVANERLEYNRDIRPILAENCFACHGPDSASRKAGLRLDKRAAAIEMHAIAPGDVKASELIERLWSTDPDAIMPPPNSHKVLTREQKALLERWIAEGAEYQPHWSYNAPVQVALPKVSRNDWPVNAIDYFVLAKLDEVGLSPGAAASKETLARRVALDLTGLPPSPEIVDEFLADMSPSAYERLVDKLLETPAWGEHRARYWLDAARYADTHGIHFDNFREMWAYRDSVIAAFNRNQPFDEFTVEQLAGDLLPQATLAQQVASGFNRCNITTNEGGAISEEYLVLYARDRTDTTSQVWLGLTAGCAVCHDHKFDEISQAEFYELSAFLNNTTQSAMDGNVKDTPPTIVYPAQADQARWTMLVPELATARSSRDSRRQSAQPEFAAFAETVSAERFKGLARTDQLVLNVPLAEGSGTEASIAAGATTSQQPLSAGTIWTGRDANQFALTCGEQGGLTAGDFANFDRTQSFSAGAWVKLPENASGSVMARMDDGSTFTGWDLWVEGNRPGLHLVHRWPDDALKVVATNPVKAGEWHHLAATYDGSGKAAGVKIYVDGVMVPTVTAVDVLQNATTTSVPLKIGQRDKASAVNGLGVYDVRVYSATLSQPDVAAIVASSRLAEVAAKSAGSRSDPEKQLLFDWWLTNVDTEFPQRQQAVALLEQEEGAIKSRGSVTHVMHEKPEEATAYVLFRGAYDQRRDAVKPATPKSLAPFPETLPRNRLGLAKWLVSPENPLTARVTVNRFWQDVFGQGLVRTSGDLGVSGEQPSHPDLLDWLAVDFRQSGWNVKRFFKQMVISATYRQSAQATPLKLEKDPGNRLLARGPRFRMDGEMIRDAALAASGLLVKTIGGPSVKPYQPDGVWEAVAMIGSNTRDYVRDKGDSLYRRSLYTFIKRSAPPASMELFNATARETCTVRRERTNTPLQALVTLNDPQFVESARVLAARILNSAQTGGPAEQDGTRIQQLSRYLISRRLTPDELTIVTASLAELRAFYRTDTAAAKELLTVGDFPADAAIPPEELAAWTMLTNELMNLDEFLTK